MKKSKFRTHSDVVVGDAGSLGRGIFAKRKILKNKFLGVYEGEIINNDECNKRLEAKNGYYIFQLSDKKFIDGAHGGNWTSLVNHSRNYNIHAISNLKNKTIEFYVSKTIQKGEQLFLFYGHNWFRDNDIEEI